MVDAEWRALYEQEYESQYKLIKGQHAMGKISGEFSEVFVKHATLIQMKKDGVFQNAINWLEIAEGPKADVADTIEDKYCTPNCVKKHQHKFMYDYTKSYKDPLEQRPGEIFDLYPDNCMVKGTPINLDSRMAIKQDFEDDLFKFRYETIDPKASYKFNQTIQSFFFPIKQAKKPNN